MPNLATSLESTLSSFVVSTSSLLPEISLVIGLILSILVEITIGKKNKQVASWSAISTIFVFLILQIWQWPEKLGVVSFLGMVVVDAYAGYMKLLIGLGALIAMAASTSSIRLQTQSKGIGEYYIVLIGMVIGCAFMTIANNLLMMYIALEMVSLPAYLLTIYTKLKSKSAEAGLKYVIYGCFASGIMLYGISWIYGFTATLNPAEARFAIGLANAGLWPTTIVLVLVLSGFAFKVGAVPFHFWKPDVYEGSSHSVATLFSVVPTVAGFAMLIRLLASLQLDQHPQLLANIQWILGSMAIVSMFVGNLSALRQGSFRRMLAYSSIAQSGYLLAATLMFTASNYAIVMFYLGIYLAMNMAAFLIAGWLEENLGIVTIKEMKGLATHLPLLAVITTIVMVALTGLPPTAGFIAKFEIFISGVQSYGTSGNVVFVFLLISLLLNTVISLFYYLKVPRTMILANSGIKISTRFHGLVPGILSIIAIALIWLGIFSFDHFMNILQAFQPFIDG